jgi:anti-sigma-K factor RskA
MNLQQLIELAVLDAMGLLDETEQHQFETAFRAASPQVQAQVRREQTRLSVMDSLLPDVSPPAGLRAAVLELVRRHILGQERDVAGELPVLRSTSRVSHLWRTASIALAAACVVLSVGTYQMYRSASETGTRLNDDGFMKAMVNKVGAAYVRDVLFDRDTRRVVFSPVATGTHGQVSAFFNPEWKEAKLFHLGLGDAEGRTYKLALIDDHNNITVLRSFNPTGEMDSVTFVLDRTLPKSRLAVLTTNKAGADEIVETGELPAPTL